MNKSDIAGARLFSQQIAATDFTKPEEIVSWLGAVQAQDYPMAKWAIGVRLGGAAEAEIETAVADARIIRTHILRPTWHFVAADDLRWMIALSAPQLRSTSAGTMRAFGLDAATCWRANDLIAETLAGGRHLTRAEIMAELKKSGIDSDNYRASYLMFAAEIEGVVCSGVRRGKDQTYALLDERAPQSKQFSREESIAELTRRYFTSHAPATLKDFVWWSGLPTSDARRGLEMNEPDITSAEIDGQTYYLPKDFSMPAAPAGALYLLPAFDEFMVAYKDRSAALDAGRASEAITGNGIFKPIIVAGGKIAGVWKRAFKKDTVIVEKILFGEFGDFEAEAFQAKAREYALFEGKNARF
ncbi:MAG TPA: winged helix DNA-binding domain-containing protein [Pyrinomonadaceae bacterium]|jgi:hypothetical protein